MIRPVESGSLVPFTLQWNPSRAHTTAVARFVHAALTAVLPPGWHTQPDHLHHRLSLTSAMRASLDRSRIRAISRPGLLGAISMMPVRFRLRVLTLTAGAAALMAPLPGFAASAQAATAGGGGHGPASAPGRAPSQSDSMTFAGYQATVAAGSATSSAAHFKVPALSCTSAFRGITPVAGVEVGGGSSYSAAFLFTGCRGGKAVYFPAVVVNGSETNYTGTPFHAGNVVAVATKVTTKGTTVSVTDTTTGVTKKRTGPGASPSAAYVGDSDWVSNGTVLRRA